MKKIGLFTSLLLLISIVQYAQTPEQKALDILKEVETKYKDKTLQAHFVYAISNKNNGAHEEIKGEFVMKKNKFRLTLADQEIYNNGSTVWTYLKDANEVNISNYSPSSEEITPDRIFTLYKKDFKSSFLEEVVEKGKVYQIIDLQPIERNKKIFKIRLKVVKNTKSIKSWEIMEKNSNNYKYTVTEISYKVAVPDSYFSFNKSNYPGVEEVDLRN